MAKIEDRIIQTRTYEEVKKAPPSEDYINTYPITVYAAVREQMADENSEKLSDALRDIRAKIDTKQDKVDDLSADHIMTFAGEKGVIGSIKITTKILGSMSQESNDRIPTERAVGDLLRRLGLVTNEGDPTGDKNIKVFWDDIIDKPDNYDELGEDPRGYVNQRALTYILKFMEDRINGGYDSSQEVMDKLNAHIQRTDNPHEVTFEQIDDDGIIERMIDEAVDEHNTNPRAHKDLRDLLAALDEKFNTTIPPIEQDIEDLKDQLASLTGSVGGMKFITDLEYRRRQDKLVVTYNDGSASNIELITDRLVETVTYDQESRNLIIKTLGGATTTISLSELVTNFSGDSNGQIELNVDENGIISATLKEGSITEKYLADKSVTTKKLDDQAVTNPKIMDATITGDKIAPDTIEDSNIVEEGLTDRVLAYGSVIEDKIKDNAVTTFKIDDLAVTTEKIGSYAVTSEKLAKDAVTEQKLADEAVSADKLAANSVIEEKLADNSVTTPKIADRNVTSEKLAENLELVQPMLTEQPDLESDRYNDLWIPSIKWVNDRINNHKFTEENLPDGFLDPSKIKSSLEDKMVLGTIEGGTNPVWTKVVLGMLDAGSVSTENIVDDAVSGVKLQNQTVTTDKIAAEAVTSQKIGEGEVKSVNIFECEETNKVLAVGLNPGHPDYTEVTNAMLAKDAIDPDKIQDKSITLPKIAGPGDQGQDLDNVVILFDEEDGLAKFGKIVGKYIEDHQIPLEKLELSPVGDVILGVDHEDTKAKYTKIVPEMLADTFQLDEAHLADASVGPEKLKDHAVTSEKLGFETICDAHIKDHGIPLNKLELPLEGDEVKPAFVVGVAKDGTDVEYLKVSNDMIEPKAVSPDKLFTSDDSEHVVIGIETAGEEPKYMKIGGLFIDDHSITGDKLTEDASLPGHPKATANPDNASDGYDLATTAWVRSILRDAGLTPEDNIVPSLAEQSVPVENIVSYDEDFMVVGVINRKENVQFTKITKEMLAPDFKLTMDQIDGYVLADPSQIGPDMVTGEAIQDKSIGSEHLKEDLALPVGTTVDHTSDMETPHVRDIYMGRTLPTTAKPGTIFLMY